MERGVWFVAAASTGLILDAPPKPVPNGLWAQTMTLMGGEFEELARGPAE